MPKDPQLILNRLICDQQTFDCHGNPLEVTGTISLLEADYIKALIIDNAFHTCLETGVAYGASTLAICAGLSTLERRGQTVKHYGVDPCQIQVYGGAALQALQECGLNHLFELCEGPSHLMLPKLIERNIAIDFVFIDGMHTFDYTLIDLFFADKLLRPGGVICIHDMNLPGKKKAVSYLMRYRKYVRWPGLKKPFAKRAGAALQEALKLAPRSSWNALTTVEPMLTVQKIEQFEPAWDFYARI